MTSATLHRIRAGDVATGQRQSVFNRNHGVSREFGRRPVFMTVTAVSTAVRRSDQNHHRIAISVAAIQMARISTRPAQARGFDRVAASVRSSLMISAGIR